MVAFAHRFHRTHAAVAGIALLVLAVLAGAGQLLLRDRRDTYHVVTTAQDDLALGLGRDILHDIDIYDVSLRATAAQLHLLSGTTGLATLNAVLFDGAVSARNFGGIAVAGADGTLTRETGLPTPQVASVVGRSAFEAHRARDDLGLLVQFSSSIWDGVPILQLTRRVTAPDGSFGGAVWGGIDLGYFREAFSHIRLPPGGLVALVGYDGNVVASVPPHLESGRTSVDGALFAKALDVRDGHGSFEVDGATSGTGRIVTVRRLGSLPFFLMVGTPQAAALAEWRIRAAATGAGLLSFVVLLSLLILVLRRELRRRKAAELVAVAASAAARAGEARLNTYVDHLADGVLALRRRKDGRFVLERINSAASFLLGLNPAVALGRVADEHGMGGIWPLPLNELVTAHWNGTDGEALRFEQVHEVGDIRRVLRIALAPVREPQPGGPADVTLLLACVWDVTHKVDLENRLRQAQRMEAMGQLTAGVAHDFNNMLQAQMGALELLLDEVADSPRAAELAQLALGAGGHGARLTHSLLSFSRQQHLAPRPVLVVAMLDRLGQMLAHTLGAQIQLRISAQDGMAAPFADSAQLEAALLNLAQNAHDAMPDGGQLCIEARDRMPDESLPSGYAPGLDGSGHCVVLAVSDTGCGMDADVVARSCEPFFTTKGVGKGSGLGLSMVQGYVQQSGGTLRILSTPGKGTRVELWLPAAIPVPPSLPAAGPGWTIASVERADRVLLVDDTPDVLAVTAEILEGAGFVVVPAANGMEALALLESEQPFDVLVTDYVMPGLHGGLLIEQACACCPGLPALVVTGHTDSAALRDLPPGVAVLHKPVRGAALVRQVSDMVASRQPGRRLGPCPDEGRGTRVGERANLPAGGR